MPRSLRTRLVPFVLGLGLACLLPLAGCGEEAPEDGPAASSAADGAVGGEEPGRPSSTALLAGLSERVTNGLGISDHTWTRDVQEVAMALWPDDDALVDLHARKDHTNLSHIAGDMAVQLGQSEDAREDWTTRDATSVEIHDAWVEASAGGPGAYKAWVAEGGHALLEKRHAAMAGERPR